MPVLRLPGRIDPLALHRRDPARFPLILESAAFEPARARHDIALACSGEGLRLDPDGHARFLDGRACPQGFARALDAAQSALAGAMGLDPDAAQAARLPFCGGWALFLSYEYAGVIEPVLSLPPAPGPLPVALALRCPGAVIVDHSEEVTWIVTEPGQAALLEALARDVAACADVRLPAPALIAGAVREASDGDFLRAVRRAKDWIAAGDAFQVNLSRRWEVGLAAGTSPAAVYAALRDANPAPFAALLAFEDWAIASSSPERLVEVRGDRIQTRPIAGTRPRLPDDDDAARAVELVGDPKERAEHIMLIDLERSDLGRVCTPGSVEVDELMAVERYAHVHHIVSNVRGRLRPDASPGDVLHALFPGGTITGCPKVRCMQIIAALEGEGRGAYTGALGYLGHDGRMDLNILIRTLTLHENRASFRAGAGIVADSDPVRELAETRAKARGLLRAFGVTG
ncbi:MAG TPA: aminodeoxychorismate synthase component I [Chiayiivirga sp.]|nr:aminodeoxychorismate synthase component I [Chiayiivirga sp.]